MYITSINALYRFQANDKRNMGKLCRLMQSMNEANKSGEESSGGNFSLLQLALKGDVSDDFESSLLKMEQNVNEQIEKEEEEKRLEEVRIEKEKKDKAERLRLKREAEVKKKERQDKLDRDLALKSLDEMVIYINNSLFFWIILHSYH